MNMFLLSSFMSNGLRQVSGFENVMEGMDVLVDNMLGDWPHIFEKTY